MKETLLFLFLLIITSQVTHFRLNTNEVKTLNTGDSLISTLGYFKATLASIGCTLQISTFKTNSYSNVGNYTSPNVTGNCKSLTIIDGAVVTESNTTYMFVGSEYNLSTILTIDDYGVIRLIGTYLEQNYVDQVSHEFAITDFTKDQTYVYPATQMTVGFMTMFNSVTNERNWEFSAGGGQLSITQVQNNGITIGYSYAAFTLNNSQILDFNGRTFPASILPNITFQPRCAEPRLYLDFKPPFVFVADPYWPKFTVYEQGRYKVLELSVNTIYQYEAWQDLFRLQTRSQIKVCPPFTFQSKGNCVTSCPSPYYHEQRGIYGFCVLTCQEYTPRNDTSRVCSCFSKYQALAINIIGPTNCTNDSTPYPYGCYCNDAGKYFDRLFELSCVTTCPQTTFGSNGLCMECPNDCKTCQIDKIFRSYLQCKVCVAGFTLTNGQCFRTCSPGMGLSIVGGVCSQCTDPNCINCTQNVSVCLTCDVLYSLEAGNCVQSCSNATTMAIYDDFSAVCLYAGSRCSDHLPTNYKSQAALKCVACADSSLFMHLDNCVSQCPSGYISNSLNSCYCANQSLITINDKCLPYVTCPIRMGWDPASSSCLSCHFGCLTCYNSACTSCNPGYFLYISPQGIRCRRKSPLYTCDTQYGWVQEVCLVLQYSDPALGLVNCYSNIPNCKACVPGRSDICVLCSPGYFVHNNTCIQTCPKGTMAYNDQVCILLEINNCKQPYLRLKSQQFQLNYKMIAGSSSYNLYTFLGKEPSNDPVGYIPIYQQMISQKNDGQFRNSEFYHPVWTCLMCEDGYGLSSDFYSCIPCPASCVTCYIAHNNSCIIEKKTEPVVPINTGCQYYIDNQTNQCVQSCSSSTSLPRLINGTLYCTQTDSTTAQNYARLDSAIYVSSTGQKTVFFIFDQTIKNANQINVNVFKQGSTPILSAGPDGTSSNLQSVSLQSGGYVSLQDTDTSNNLYILNMTGQVKALASSSLIFPNTVYGATSSQSHPEFMKTWLAYIGYIMGLTLILLHVVFIGNDLLYKVDNTIILAQTIYFFSFIQLLVGKLLAQFYYGWIFTHFGFFPNFFIDTIPSNYMELSAPNSYKLATLDANVVRNAGFAFSLLIVFIGAYGLIAIFCWIATNVFHKPDVWHPKIAMNSLIGGLQFISMTIFYWSSANLMYISGADSTNADFYQTSKSVSIFFIVIISVYTIARWIFHPIGGLYMAKRILLAAILAGSYKDTNMIAPLIILETAFTIFRYLMQRPEKKRDQFYLVIEFLIHIGVYLLLWLSLDTGVNTIIISIFMFVLIVSLAHDLTEVYLESQNQWLYEEEEETDSENMAKAEADYERKKSSVMVKQQ